MCCICSSFMPKAINRELDSTSISEWVVFTLSLDIVVFVPPSQDADNGGLEMEIDCNNLQQQLPINAWEQNCKQEDVTC